MIGWKGFWDGEIDSKMEELYNQYDDIFGIFPDGYFDIYYGDLSYETFYKAIEKAIKKKKEVHYFIPKKNWLDT